MTQDEADYRCKHCLTIVPRGSHHKMEACKCGKIQVDRGWYGSRVLFPGSPMEDHVEVIPAALAKDSGGKG